MTSNPAAMNGWVKSTDPKTGRVFYANHVTRKTQWEKPEGWLESDSLTPPPNPYPKQSSRDDEDELPANWEMMVDPTSGKPFYVDHERKVTTWVRPTERKAKPLISHAPAPVATSATYGSTLFHPASSNNSSGRNASSSFQQPSSSYYSQTFSQPHQWHQEQVDFSDSMPSLEFTVKKVDDALRDACAHCGSIFTLSKRRHHCRLCGDVFCDACSSHRVELPLEGAEFDKPVRVCDFCFQDVDKGNFFSTRRYFTPIELYRPELEEQQEEGGVATSNNVNAALAALTSDLDQMLHNPDTTLEEKITIPPKVFIPALIRHLKHRDTADRTVRALASVLALESIAGKVEYAHAVYMYGERGVINDLLGILERSGSDRRTLFIHEQASRSLFYMTDPQVLTSLERKYGDSNDSEELGGVEALDIPRSLQNMLDHASVSKNPNLQRWSTSTVRNLVLEDQRRACMSINQMAATVACGEAPQDDEYQSILDQFAQTGGIMILCSLIGADDSDTRAHATGALGAILSATRAIDASRAALAEMTGGGSRDAETKDGEIIRAIIAGGGCGSSVSQLLLSADNTVAGMGCELCASLVGPLLSKPDATANLPTDYDWRTDRDDMGACREAALEIVCGSCLPALLSLLREHQIVKRPVELQTAAMEALAASVLAVGAMGKAWSRGKYEEGLEQTGAPSKLKEALSLLNEEGVIDAAVEVMQSSSGQSLGSSADTPASRMREGAGIILSSLTSCSAEAIMDLRSRNILPSLLMASNDASINTPSTLRGDAAPRCLGVLETMSSLMIFAWQNPSGSSSELLDSLIAVLDVGAISFLSKVLSIKIEFDSTGKAVGGMKARAACFRLLCCLFGIALTDETAIGMRRLMDAVDADAYAYAATSRQHRGPQNIVEAVLGSLQVATSYARKVLMGTKSHGSHYHTALMDMVEASLLATSSMCGSSIAPGGSEGRLIKGESFLAMRSDDFVSRRRDICSAACDVVVRGSRSGPMLLPTMLVGGFGEGVVRASLRLSLAIAQNGTETQHAKLALSGIMVPISDQMRDSLSSGDLYKFSAALTLVRFCGPHIASGESGGLQSVRDAIRVVTNVLTLPIPPDISIEQTNTQESLKSECISALESLSKNAALWSAISSDALPSLVVYLRSSSNVSSANSRQQQTHCAALRAVLQIVQVPSHALSAAEAGMAEPLGKILLNRKSPSSAKEDVESESTILALEVLHAIAKNPESRRRAALLDVGVARDICCAIANAATSSPRKPVDGRANITLIGLDVLHSILSDVEGEFDTQTLLESPGAIAFLDAVASEPTFVRALCATILMESGMQLNGLESGSKVDIPSLYGSPLVLVNESFRGFANTHEAAAALFMSAAVYACAIDSSRSESFWSSCLLRDIASTTEPCERARAASTLCAYVLALIDNGFAPFLPRKKVKEADFITLCKPLVLHQLLEALRDSMKEITAFGDEAANDYAVMLVVDYNLPKICLTMWEDSALLDVSFELLKLIVELNPDDVLHLFVASGEVLLSLFDKLNINPAGGIASDVSEIRKFLASIIGKLADSGLLKDTVERFSLRSSAIGALAAACLAEEEITEDDEDATSNRLASALMRSLVELCTIKTPDGSRSEITLSSVEAEAIARNLGRKICHMVLSRFLERAKLQQYDIEEEDNILEAPDVAMLCAISQHDNALDILRAIGGLHALSQIASEGEMSAVMALKKACENDPAIILEADTYKGITALFTKDDHDALWRESVSRRDTLECAGYNILGQVCSLQRGRRLIGNSDEGLQCVSRALEIVSSLVHPIATENLQMDTIGSTTVDGDHGAIDDDPPPVIRLEELKDSSLCSAVLSFLSEVIHVECIRNAVIEDSAFLDAAFLLALCKSHPWLQFEATKLLKSISPYATTSSQALNSNKIADVLNNVLTVDVPSDSYSDSKIDMNTLHNTAIEGINILFRCLSNEMQLTLAKAIEGRLSKLVKSLAASRANSSTGAKLACNACNILLIARCRADTEEVFSRQCLVTLINLLQWRYDTRTRLLEGTTTFWNAAVTYCLQILSITLSTTNECLSQDGVQVKQIAATTLMLVRPGKAPRKAPDVLAALKQAIESGDAAAKLAAEQISKLLLEVDR